MFASPSEGNFPYRLVIDLSFKVNIHGVPFAGRERSQDMVSNPHSCFSVFMVENLFTFVGTDVWPEPSRKIYFNEIQNSSLVARRPGLSISRCTTLENNILDSTHDCKLP
jgi:hypothetical protein